MVVDDGWRRADFCGSAGKKTGKVRERKEVILLNTVKQRTGTRKKEKEPEDVKNKQHGEK